MSGCRPTKPHASSATRSGPRDRASREPSDSSSKKSWFRPRFCAGFISMLERRTDAIAVRPAAETDLERLVEIHRAAYPDARGDEPRLRNFTHNAWGGLERLYVAERAGAVIAH